MHPHDLEPEIEDLLLRLVPELSQQWQGATPEEIDAIETIAGRPLPPFYRWFLMRMGRKMGPVAYPHLDFAAPTVLACYREGLFPPHPRYLMIGQSIDEVMPLHVLYDFEHPARDDARITRRHAQGGGFHNQFATFREMIAYGEVSVRSVKTRAQRCEGVFIDRESRNVCALLEPVMRSLGFDLPVATGEHCGIYSRFDAAMIMLAPLDRDPWMQVFRLGASDQGRIRRILGEIATETSLEIEVDKWEPPI